jgi:hypothetical protein
MFAVGAALCALAFLSSYLLGRRSLMLTLLCTLAWGYFYGILRANVLSPASHFIFDCSLIGCYLSQLFRRVPLETRLRGGALSDWVLTIFAWTFLIALIPFQTPLVTLVGLRGNFLFVPVLLLASRLSESEFRGVGVGLALLNLVSFGFGFAEYTIGVEAFYPMSPVTEIIYRSRDAGGGNYRIPATFANAHSYAGAMVSTLPVLFTITGLSYAPNWQKLFCIAGATTAMFGVLFANTRTNFVLSGFVLVTFLLMGKMRFTLKALLVSVIGIVIVVALSNERFQRFRSLENTDMVAGRIAGSVNRSFIEVLTEYPMGNGLGGGGTSVPHFLAHQVRHAISVENEYARIALELGIPGLILWVSFIAWLLIRGFTNYPNDPWKSGRRLVWLLLTFGFGMSLIGTGMLTGIPGTMMTFIWAGWLITKPQPLDVTAAMEGAKKRKPGIGLIQDTGEMMEPS